MMNTYDYLLKVLVTGDSGVGKSSLLQSFAQDNSSMTKNTSTGIEFKTRTMDRDGKTVKFQIWTGEVTRSYYHNFMVVYDVTNKTSFDNVKQRLRQINRCTNDNLTTILVGNKCGLESQRVVDTASAQAFAAENGILFMETSDKDTTSVEEAFMAIAACRMASQPGMNDSRLVQIKGQPADQDDNGRSGEKNDVSWEPQTPYKTNKKRKNESGERWTKPKRRRKVIRAKVAVDIFADKKASKRSQTPKPKYKKTTKSSTATPKPATPEKKSWKRRRNYKSSTAKRSLDLLGEDSVVRVTGGKKRKRKSVSNKKQNGREIVAFENKSLIKAPETKAEAEEIKAKVIVDPESHRRWTLWVNNEPQEEEKDEEKAKAWEQEKIKLASLFKPFLATMRAVFGNMQFSRWKGSVTDSLIGVFLTRNVRDVSSSNIYMKMVAKFSAKLKKPIIMMKTRLQMKNTQIKRKEKRQSEKKQNKSKKRGQSKKKTITNWDKTKDIYWKGKKAADSDDTKDTIEWDLVRQSDPKILKKILKGRGMHNMIGMLIMDFLNRIYREHGSTDLEWLRDLPDALAKEFLMSIDGIGLKSTECVRLLSLWQKAFPVDTNISRILVRLGWIPILLPYGVEFHHVNNYGDFDGAQKYVWPRLTEESMETLYELHYNLITFGKTFCTKAKPNCTACPMKNQCKYYASANKSNVPLLRDIEDAADLDVGKCLLSNLSTSQSDQTDDDEEIFEPEPITIIPNGHDHYYSSDESNNIQELTPDHVKNQLATLINFDDFDDPKKTLGAHTMHPVFVIPDHIILTLKLKTKLEPRVNGNNPYLFLIWPKEKRRVGTTKNYESLEGSGPSNDKSIVLSSPQVLWFGTILIPCRTANRGSFPLNGTYFQINEVFADFETTVNPIGIPSTSLSTEVYRLYCGTSTSSMVGGHTLELIQKVYKGFICVREFNRRTLSPMRLSEKFHRRSTP